MAVQRKHALLLLAILAAFITVAWTPFAAADSGGRVVGRVVGVKGAGSTATVPIANATVTTRGAGEAMRALTDANGQYSIDNVTAGVYNITASAYGYDSETQLKVTISDGINLRLDFTLTKTGVAAAQPVETFWGVPVNFIIGVILVGILAAVALVLFLKRRSLRKTSKPSGNGVNARRCRYCKGEIVNPGDVQCPNCHRLFPLG